MHNQKNPQLNSCQHEKGYFSRKYPLKVQNSSTETYSYAQAF